MSNFVQLFKATGVELNPIFKRQPHAMLCYPPCFTSR